MTLTNAIKKAEKTSKQTATKNGQFYTVDYRGYTVQFAQNGREDAATNFYTRKHGVNDDLATDYFAGTFHDNITQAFKFVDYMTNGNA